MEWNGKNNVFLLFFLFGGRLLVCVHILRGEGVVLCVRWESFSRNCGESKGEKVKRMK